MAMSANSVRGFWSATTAASTAAGTPIGEITDFAGPGGNAAVIDITHLLSTAKEKIMGLADEGQMSLGLNYNATDAGQIALKTDRNTRAKKKVTIKFPYGTAAGTTAAAVFDGYCLGYSISGAVDNKISANVVIEISGAVTWTTG